MELTKLIGKGAQANVYEWEGKAVKLFAKDYPKTYVFYETALTSVVAATGLPVADIQDVCRIDGCWAIVMDLVCGERVSGEDMPELVALQRRIHEVPNPLPVNNRYIFARNIRAATQLTPVEKEWIIAYSDALPDGDRLCHNDYHRLNVLKSDKGLYVIDWINAAGGNPESDCCRTYMILKLYNDQWGENYLAAYCRQAGIEEENILRWLPVTAAQRLLEKKPGEEEQLLAWSRLKS